MKKSCTPNQPLRMIVLAPAQSGWEKSGSLGRKCPCAWKSTTETMAMKRRPSIWARTARKRSRARVSGATRLTPPTPRGHCGEGRGERPANSGLQVPCARDNAAVMATETGCHASAFLLFAEACLGRWSPSTHAVSATAATWRSSQETLLAVPAERGGSNAFWDG